MKKNLVILAAVAGLSGFANAEDMALYPTDAKPGECYAKVSTPATFKTVSRQILKRAESKTISVIPAKYETFTEQVMTQEPSYRLVNVPATYAMESERILDRPAFAKWEVKDGVHCKVEVPASYKVIQKKVVSNPATTRKVEIPAQYKTITKTRLVSEAKTIENTVPAKYETVTETVKVKDETLAWDRVLCKRNLTFENVSAIQKELKAKGFYKAPVDGLIGSKTIWAATKYAKANNLPYGDNFISFDVAKSLGLTTNL